MSRFQHSSHIFWVHTFISALTGGFIYSSILFIAIFSINTYADPLEENLSEEITLHEINSFNDIHQGQLVFKTDQELLLAPLLDTDVDMQVIGMIGRVKLQQKFTNTTQHWQEGVYVFPLPEDAAVDQLKMIIGERIIEGKIKPKQKAKQIYQQAKAAGKKTSLVKQERTNIFTTSVANIAPGESITIQIEYQQLVRYDSGVFRLRFPMVVAPRYIPDKQAVTGFAGTGWAKNTDQVQDAARITPHVIKDDNKLKNPVAISVKLTPGFDLQQIYSPYHSIDVEHLDSQYQINLTNNATPANRDFELVWKPQLTNTINAALFTENYASDEYAMLMLLPDVTNKNQTQNIQHDREIIFVIDTSGSMAGESIKQAKSALTSAIARLKPTDTFNVIEFNSHTRALFSSPKIANGVYLKKAFNFIKRLDATGGTEMLPAMQMALQQSGAEHSVSQVIFMTDGSIGNEDALFQLIQQDIDNSRLFAIGIGSAPNSHFMNRAAQFGKGSFTYIGKTSEVEEKVNVLFNKIENTVLTDIQLAWPEQISADDIETWPQAIPDVYLGEPLLVVMKSEDIPESVVVTGRTAHQKWQSRIDLIGGQNHHGIAKLWARRKIAALMDQRLFEHDKTLIEQTITQLGMQYHLVSKFTSLVAVDVTPSRPIGAELDSKALPTKLPQGWEHNKVFGPMPQTATPAMLHLMIGCILLVVSCLGRRLTRNVH